MPPILVNRSKIIAEMMKFSFHQRAIYCFLGMVVWISLLITVVYKYMSEGEEVITPKKVVPNEYLSKSDQKFMRIYLRACNPPENIVRGTEGVVDRQAWKLHGVLVLTRHGDRGPLTHLKGGDKLPCDVEPYSPLLKSYEEFVQNASVSGRPFWVSSPGPFHNFPSLPPRAPGTHCALGQLTPRGLLQMLTVGNILREAYWDDLALSTTEQGKKENSDEVIMYSTRYRRTFQSLVSLSWGLARAGGGALAARAKESHSVAFCMRDCACHKHNVLNKKITSQAKNRLETHPAIKDLVNRLSKVLFESQEKADADVVRDAILAYMCHDAPFPCTEKTEKNKQTKHAEPRSFHAGNQRALMQAHGGFNMDIGNAEKTKHATLRSFHAGNERVLMQADENFNMEFDNTEKTKHAKPRRSHAGNERVLMQADENFNMEFDYAEKQKAPLDFDAQMEREKLLYYQQKYMDNAEDYEDVVVVRRNLDADFNFPNDARMDAEFDEDYKEPSPTIPEDFCIKKEHVMSLFSYLEWSYKQEVKNVHNRRRGLLVAYGLIHNIVQNIIRMISENKPKFVLYSGHDKTLQALILALGLNNYQHYNIQYAARMIFEVYRKRDLKDKFVFQRRATAQDFYFRVVYNGEDITTKLSFCKGKNNILMKLVDTMYSMSMVKTYLCPIENIVRFIHEDYFAPFNASNFKDACASYDHSRRH